MTISLEKKLVQEFKKIKDQAYMSDEQIAVFSQYYQQKTDELDRIIEELNAQILSLSELAKEGDEADRANTTVDLNMILNTLNLRRQEKNQIAQQQQRIKNDSFGYCVDCGEDIGLLRLSHQPLSIKDVECESLKSLRSNY